MATSVAAPAPAPTPRESIFQHIMGFEHTFVGWFVKGFQTAQKDAPTVQKVAAVGIPYIKAAVQIASEFEPAVAKSLPVLDEINTDTTLAASLIHDFGATPTVGGTVQTITDNLSAIEQAGHFKSAQAQDAIAKGLQSAQALSAVISGAVAAFAPAQPAA